MINILKASLWVAAFSLFASNVSAQTCGLQPTCDELGYEQTSSDCSGHRWILKCPFDHTKLFCGDSGGSGGSGDTPVSQDWTVGAIVYSDKTISTQYIRTKTPIGIVVDTTFRLIVALEDGYLPPEVPGDNGNMISWWTIPLLDTSSHCSFTAEAQARYCHGDLSFMTDYHFCSDESTVFTCETDGKSNTAKLISYQEKWKNTYSTQCPSDCPYVRPLRLPAAEYCYNYTTEGTKVGDWYLPSMYELKLIYNNKTKINATLQLIGKSSLTDNRYLSSNITKYISDPTSSWSLNMSNGYKSYIVDEGAVRPVLTF